MDAQTPAFPPAQLELPLAVAAPPADVTPPDATLSDATRSRGTFSLWSLIAFAGSAAVVGMIMVGASRGQPHAQEPAPAATYSKIAEAPVQSRIPETTIAPTWAGHRRATWGRDGSKTIAFELQAVDEVPVWMSRVRPVLVVRCLDRKTEVFVATGSASSVESRSDSHTVHVRIDDDQDAVQQWSDSESGQELFAPDGVALVRRLARAHSMRFGFTPYNAKAVTAQFLVDGFEQLASLVAKTCAWRLDDRGSAAARPSA